MTCLYSARHLLPISSPPIEDGALLVHEGRIKAVGNRANLVRSNPGVERVDFGDAVLLPPLVNAHTHLELTDFPSWAEAAHERGEPDGFVDWIERVIRVKRSVEQDQFAVSVKRGLRQLLEAGTGAVGDTLSWFPARSVYAESPLFGHLFLEVIGRDRLLFRNLLASVGKILQEQASASLAYGVSPHSLYNLSSDSLETALALVQKTKVLASLHLAESSAETEFLQRSGGPIANHLFRLIGWEKQIPPASRLSPVAFAAARGALRRDCLLVHGVQVPELDMPAIAESRATVVLCPRSNQCLGVGVAPVAGYRKYGIPLALGTDSRASVANLSLWDEIAFARVWFAGQLEPQYLLGMATRNGARALGLDDEIGSLQRGKGAHFQVLRPEVVPSTSDLFDYLTSPGRTSEVEQLYLRGDRLLPNP